MPKGDLIIRVKNNNRKVDILAQVKDSLHASRLADRINSLPYMKVYERRFYKKSNYVKVRSHAILGAYNYEQLHSDLELMSDLIIMPNESI